MRFTRFGMKSDDLARRNLLSAHKGSNMAAERSEPVQVYRTHINVGDAYELNYWLESLGVSQDMLAELVQEAGTSIDAVDAALQRRRATGSSMVVVSIPSAAKYRSPSRAQAPKIIDSFRA